MKNVAGRIGFFAFFAFIIACAVGWVMNIISLVSNNESVGMMIGRVIGIFMVPVGSLLGLFF